MHEIIIARYHDKNRPLLDLLKNDRKGNFLIEAYEYGTSNYTATETATDFVMVC